MKNRILFALVGLMLPLLASAQRITREEALLKATDFLNYRGKTVDASTISKAPRRDGKSDCDAAYYVFNATGKNGFVIVSGDERTNEAILGYSDEGCFDEANIPENMKAWLDGYAKEICRIPEGYRRIPSNIDFPVVEPLLKTKWNQWQPYNGQCPEENGYKCPTGCTATAIAQIMNYWKYPEVLPAVPGFEERAIDWSAIKNEYDNGEVDDNVAWLMRYVGQANYMNYSVENASSANFSYNVSRMFGYNKFMRKYLRTTFSNKEWHGIINEELSSGRPVFYQGTSDFGGHAFVCDGSDGNGYYHFNWGWGGEQDGYFLLNALNGYNTTQVIVAGIAPYETIPFFEGEIRVSEFGGVVGYVSYPYGYLSDFPQLNDICSYDEGFCLLNEDGSIGDILALVVDGSWTGGVSDWITEDGTFKVVYAIRLKGEEEWRSVCHDYNYIEVTRNGSELSYVDSRFKYQEDLGIEFKTIGEMKVGSSPEIEITFTNKGQKDVVGTYCCYAAGTPSILNQNELMGEIDLYLSPNESTTKTYTLSDWFTLDEVGKYKLRIVNWISPTSSDSESFVSGISNVSIIEHEFILADEDGNVPPSCEAPEYSIKQGKISGESATEGAVCAFKGNLQRSGSLMTWFGESEEPNNRRVDLKDCLGEEFDVFIYSRKEGLMRSDIKKETIRWDKAEIELNDNSPAGIPLILEVKDGLLTGFYDREGCNGIMFNAAFVSLAEQEFDKEEGTPITLTLPIAVCPTTVDGAFSDLQEMIEGKLILFATESDSGNSNEEENITDLKIDVNSVVSITNLSGQQVFKGRTSEMPTLPKGIYIMKQGGRTVKVSI